MNNDLLIRGPIAIRSFALAKKCEANVGHTHNYDHTTLVVKGRIKVIYRETKDGPELESREFGVGETVVIKANIFHTIKALEDDALYYCIYSHRDFDGLVTQVYQGNASAYV